MQKPLAPSMSPENTNAFIQGPRGQKARKYNNKEDEKKKGKEKKRWIAIL